MMPFEVAKSSRGSAWPAASDVTGSANCSERLIRDARTADLVTHGAEASAPKPLAWLSAAQKDRCVYCGCETWLPPLRRQEAKLRAKWDIPAERSLACQLAFDHRMASIEHLRRRADAGDDSPANLAMACAYCNSSRRERTPEIHALVMCGLKRVGRHPCFAGASQARAPERARPSELGEDAPVE